MASQFRVVSSILDDAAYRADIQGMLDRHPLANQLRLFNESVQQLRLRMSNLGFEGFLAGTSPTALSLTAAATGETYSEEIWPADACNIYAVHVLFETNLWIPLKPISLAGIRDYQRQGPLGVSLNVRAAPAAFALRQAPLGVVAVETAGKIIMVPLPTVARQFRIFYLQNWTDALSTDTFNGFDGFIEWIIWDMVVKYSARDNDSNQTYQIATLERARIELELGKMVPRTQMGSSEEPRRADDDDGYNPFQVRELV